MGMNLEEQLRDDPIYAGLNDSNLKKDKKFQEEYLKPLECMIDILKHLIERVYIQQ